MANRGSIAAMGRAARLRAEQVFGIDVMIDAWIAALERAIARHRTRHS
jgi:hypothetical protein